MVSLTNSHQSFPSLMMSLMSASTRVVSSCATSQQTDYYLAMAKKAREAGGSTAMTVGVAHNAGWENPCEEDDSLGVLATQWMIWKVVVSL